MLLKKTVCRSITLNAEEVREMIADFLTKKGLATPGAAQALSVTSSGGGSLLVYFEKEDTF